MAAPMYSRFQAMPVFVQPNLNWRGEADKVRPPGKVLIVVLRCPGCPPLPLERPASHAGPAFSWKRGAWQTPPIPGFLLLVDRSPSGHLVTLAGFQRPTVVELQFCNPATDRFCGRTGVAKTADANHVSALLVIGVGIEKIVADVFENIFDLAAGHA